MAGKELIVAKPKDLAAKEQKDLPLSIVYYEREGDSGYSFLKVFDEKRSVRIDQAGQEYQESEFVGAEFEEEVKDFAKEYYKIAAACGVLTATLSSVRLSDLFEMKEKLNSKDIEKYVVAAARLAGYKKQDYRGAAQYVMKKAVPFVAGHTPPQVLNYFADLSSNPKMVGLVFSIISQFTGEKYKIDDKGKILKRPLPDYYAIGNTPAEKVLYGLLYWVFALAANTAVSKKNVVDDIRGHIELLNVLRNFVDIPLMKQIPKDLTDAEKKYSVWIRKLFEDSRIMDVDGTWAAFDLLQLIKAVALEAIEGAPSVILNECLFRGFYFIKKMTVEMQAKQIRSFEELDVIDPHDVLPFNNQIVSRMAVIASGTFVAANLACATIKALFKKKDSDGKKFPKAVLAEANIAGIGRFVLAIGVDSKYWIEDIKVLFVRKPKDTVEISIEDVIGSKSDTADVFSVLSLEAIQARMLYCFESAAVLEDIRTTRSDKDKALKKEWLSEWQDQIVKGLGYQDDDFFDAKEKDLFDYLKEQSKNEANLRWIYLMSMELALFKAYQPLGSEKDKAYGKLTFKEETTEKVYLNKQQLVKESEWKTIKSDYKRHHGLISGRTQNLAWGAGIFVVVVAASGGLAAVFAPKIAILLAGEAVAGLHGAALTSASLAFVGGGALAAGGGGMAAGAAIITGGGALLGAAGSGSASLIAFMAQASPGMLARQGAKLATFCSAVLHDVLNDDISINSILTGIVEAKEAVEKIYNEMNEDKSDLDKDILKLLDKYKKYLERTEDEIRKTLK